jgi:hypothetical protein
MMKTVHRAGSPRPQAKAAAKAASAKLVAVRPAAQKPVHATRSDMRRAVRAVAADRLHADA